MGQQVYHTELENRLGTFYRGSHCGKSDKLCSSNYSFYSCSPALKIYNLLGNDESPDSLSLLVLSANHFLLRFFSMGYIFAIGFLLNVFDCI